MEGLKAVLFDWDGTLVDSAEMSYRCYASLFSSYGIPFTTQDFHRTYSPDWHKTYADMHLDRTLWEEADGRWLDFYQEGTTCLRPFAHDVLVGLRDSGFGLGLVTSGDRRRVLEEGARLGVADFFQTTVCAGDAPFPKPHPSPLLLALQKMDLSPHDVAYVGDSPEDVLMARSAHVISIGVPGGFPNEGGLRASAPDLLVEDLKEAHRALVGDPHG